VTLQRTRIKVCGVTRREDADVAVAAGADAIGVIFAPSPRQVTLAQAAAALAGVPPLVARVGVFVDATLDEIEAAILACGLTAVQFSGAESPSACRAVSRPVIKAVRVGTDFGSECAEPYRGYAAALLLDTYVTGKAGGTSQTFDWQRAGECPGWASVFVAGGLNPSNVSACIAALRPYAVDVSSGVEERPGIKDHDKVRAFCAAVRTADRGVSSE